MAMTIFIMIIGLCLLLGGASVLVDASVAIARRLGVSDFIIGITIVGMGTSAPELYVSVSSTLQGMGDVAIGNVIGSNICNSLLILGATALVRAVPLARANLRTDVSATVMASLLFVAISYITMIVTGAGNPLINRWGGAILLMGLAIFLWRTFAQGNVADESAESPTDSWIGRLPIWATCVCALASLAALLGGGNLFLDSAVTLAHAIGISEFAISVTVVAVGTSLPELTTCIIAAMRGNSALALGNVLGSNLFNILFILGVSSVITPIAGAGVETMDYIMLVGSALLVWLWAATGKKMQIDRWEGAVAVLLYVGYTVILLCRGSWQ
ncbi:MAG: calcium/sodium antiporter [Muribaculaceae bacterium]|nr:calcium/sodium antiporter [Muribaculaceae bacterium]